MTYRLLLAYSSWKLEYNSRSPYSSLGYLTPDE
jgi:hypothetical protein